VTKLQKVIDGETDTVGVIGDDTGHAFVEYRAVHEYKRGVLLPASRDDIIMEPCGGEDESIDLPPPAAN